MPREEPESAQTAATRRAAGRSSGLAILHPSGAQPMVNPDRGRNVMQTSLTYLTNAALITAGLSLCADAAPATSAATQKCSPPIRADLSLTLDVEVEGGGLPYAGSTGTLTFTIRHLGPSAPARFSIYHGLQPVPDGEVRRLTLLPVEGDSCYLNALYVAPNTYPRPTGWYYTLNGPQLSAGDELACRTRFLIAETATGHRSLRFNVWPRDCHTDIAPDDNHEIFSFGGRQAEPVPILNKRGWVDLTVLSTWIIGMLLLSDRWFRDRRNV